MVTFRIKTQPNAGQCARSCVSFNLIQYVMRTIMFVLMVSLLSMSSAAQYNTEMLSAPVDTTYFLNGELSGNWAYGAVPEAIGAYRNNFGAMTMIVYSDSLMLDGHMYPIAYSKLYRNRKVVLLVDWSDDNRDMAEITIVKRQFPSTWWSVMVCTPKRGLKYRPEPVYHELYKVDLHWLGSKYAR